jgi:hypothetical protein
MFQVCLDDRSASRLALVWLPTETRPVPEVGPDAKAANLLFSILDREPQRRPAPKRRRRKAAAPAH